MAESAIATSIWFWVAFNAVILAILAFDLGVLHRGARAITAREGLAWTAVWSSLAAAFCAGLWLQFGREPALEFATGYLIEYSLSVDNIFVFVMLFAHFAVPPEYRHRVLFWGIIGALVMRGALIYLGATLIQQFHWVIYIFGAFLVLTGVKMLLLREAESDPERNIVVRWARRRFKVTPNFHGERFFVRLEGVRYATPLFLVLLCIETTDLIFALDSIPAIFAVTDDPFIVYTANVFAILGLRSLYFALAGLVDKFHFLKIGLSLVLVFIGVKMILNGIFGGKFLPIEYALIVTAAIIGASVVASLIFPKERATGLKADLGRG